MREVHVTPSQAAAAKRIVAEDKAKNRPTSEAIRKIAEAKADDLTEPAREDVIKSKKTPRSRRSLLARASKGRPRP